MAKNGDHRLDELDDDKDQAEQAETQYKCSADTNHPCSLPLMLGQLVGQDGDEDQVVDTEHDFHGDECAKRAPSRWIRKKDQDIVHSVRAHPERN